MMTSAKRPHAQQCFLVLHGSFNPVHREHVEALRLAGSRLAQDYEVVRGYLAPTSDSHVASKGEMTLTFEHRVKCCKEALEEYGENWMRVHSSGPEYSSGRAMVDHLVRELADQFPGITGFPVSGADSAEKYLEYMRPGVAVGRAGYLVTRADWHREFYFAEASGELSSTKARGAFGKPDLATYCGERVAKYINEKLSQLDQRDRLFLTWPCTKCAKEVPDGRWLGKWWCCTACWVEQGKIVAIVGASRSGKTTLASGLKEKLQGRGYVVEIVHQDAFRSGGKVYVEDKTSWESEQLTDWAALTDWVLWARPRCHIVLVEGYLLYHGGNELVAAFDMCLYVNSTMEQCRERGRSKPWDWASVDEYIEKCVWPCHLAHQERIPFGNASYKVTQLDARSDLPNRFREALCAIQDLLE